MPRERTPSGTLAARRRQSSITWGPNEARRADQGPPLTQECQLSQSKPSDPGARAGAALIARLWTLKDCGLIDTMISLDATSVAPTPLPTRPPPPGPCEQMPVSPHYICPSHAAQVYPVITSLLSSLISTSRLSLAASSFSQPTLQLINTSFPLWPCLLPTPVSTFATTTLHPCLLNTTSPTSMIWITLRSL